MLQEQRLSLSLQSASVSIHLIAAEAIVVESEDEKERLCFPTGKPVFIDTSQIQARETLSQAEVLLAHSVCRIAFDSCPDNYLILVRSDELYLHGVS